MHKAICRANFGDSAGTHNHVCMLVVLLLSIDHRPVRLVVANADWQTHQPRWVVWVGTDNLAACADDDIATHSDVCIMHNT